MRPTYETPEYSKEEHKVIEAYCEKINATPAKLPIKYFLDYSLVKNGRVIALAEVKVRTHKFRYYPTYMIAMGKVKESKMLYETVYLKTKLIVSFVGEIYVTDLHEAIGAIMSTGRNDRGDWQDIEPCMMIPVDLFKDTGLRINHEPPQA